MRYDDRATREALAAEYVLGSLKGPARRRFERLMAQRPEWRDEVEFWSARLAGLAATAPSVTPPASLWQKIQNRINAPRPEARSRALRWWQGLAAVSSLAAVVLAIMLIAVPYQPTFSPALVNITVPANIVVWAARAAWDRNRFMTHLLVGGFGLRGAQCATDPLYAGEGKSDADSVPVFDFDEQSSRGCKRISAATGNFQ